MVRFRPWACHLRLFFLPWSFPPFISCLIVCVSGLVVRYESGTTSQSIFGQGLELLWASVQDEAPVTAQVADQVTTGERGVDSNYAVCMYVY